MTGGHGGGKGPGATAAAQDGGSGAPRAEGGVRR
jgi:hypothetical protein